MAARGDRMEPMAEIRTRFSDVAAFGSLPWLKRGACRQTATLGCLSPVSPPAPLSELAVWMSACPAFLPGAAGSLDAF